MTRFRTQIPFDFTVVVTSRFENVSVAFHPIQLTNVTFYFAFSVPPKFYTIYVESIDWVGYAESTQELDN